MTEIDKTLYQDVLNALQSKGIKITISDVQDMRIDYGQAFENMRIEMHNDIIRAIN